MKSVFHSSFMNFSLVPSSPEHWTTFAWILAALAAFGVGLSKTGFNGVGIAYVLIMANIMGARASTGFVLPLLLFADFFAVFLFRRHADWSHIRRLVPPTMIGIVAGYFIMQHVSDAAYKPFMGWFVLVLSGLQWLRGQRESWFAHLPHNPVWSNSMGLGCGVATMLANGSGPIATLYLLVSGLSKMEFVGTGAWFFFLMNWFKVPFSWHMGLINLDSLKWNLWLFPAVALGIFAGKWLLARVSQQLFETLLLWFSVLAALRLIFS